MNFLKIISITFLICGNAFAEEGEATASGQQYGFNLGIGLPYIGQVGVNYRLNAKWAVSAGYNLLKLDVDEATAELEMPEIFFQYYPWAGSFFIGAGLGKESLEVTAKEQLDGDPISIEVDAMTTIAKLGWTWGTGNGGFWYGVDMAYIMPNSPDVTTNAPGVLTSDPNYQDAIEAAEDFGETSYPNITFIRVGYIF